MLRVAADTRSSATMPRSLLGPAAVYLHVHTPARQKFCHSQHGVEALQRSCWQLQLASYQNGSSPSAVITLRVSLCSDTFTLELHSCSSLLSLQSPPCCMQLYETGRFHTKPKPQGQSPPPMTQHAVWWQPQRSVTGMPVVSTAPTAAGRQTAQSSAAAVPMHQAWGTGCTSRQRRLMCLASQMQI